MCKESSKFSKFKVKFSIMYMCFISIIVQKKTLDIKDLPRC